MSDLSTIPELRSLVAAVVRETVADLVAESLRGQDVVAAAGPAATGRSAEGPAVPTGPAAGRDRVEAVRIADDVDLDHFARHMLELFENPKNRQDLRTGRLRFHLLGAGGPASPGLLGSATTTRLTPGHGSPQGTTGPVQRVERGAVTERQVAAAAEKGLGLVLGPRAVITPLGREKARALGVHIERER